MPDYSDPVLSTQSPSASKEPQQESTPKWQIDRRDRLALPLTLLVALLAVQVLLYSPALPGLGMTALVLAWYVLRRWHGGKASFATRSSKLLLVATALLALTFALFSNPYLRLINFPLLFCLMVVQFYEGTPGAGSWQTPSVLFRRAALFFIGLFCRLEALGAVLTGLAAGRKQKRFLSALSGTAVGLILLGMILPLLRSADAIFASLTNQAAAWMTQNLSQTLFRLVLSVILTPFLFSLLHQLRYPKAPSDTAAPHRTDVDPSMSIVILLLLDITYLFFLGTQLAALFGGEDYVSAAGVSYAEYARSGFFQLVWVALLNLTVIVLCVHLSLHEGRGWKAVQILSTLLVVLTAVLLVSACARMTLYVTVYGLSMKRLFTYWAMAFLGICLLCALRKIFVPSFGFFRICFSVGVTCWLLFNYVGPDALIARYNVSAYQSGQIEWIDTDYLATLSYDTLDILEELPNCQRFVADRRALAAESASNWQTWSFSAWRNQD